MKSVTLDKKKITLIIAKRAITVNQIAERYGATSQRVSVILNSVSVAPKTAGKLAKALGVDVTEIIEQ